MRLVAEKNLDCEFFGEKEYGFSVCCKEWNEKEKIIIYSFGIGENLSFSEQIAKKYENAEIYAFDPTPKSISFVENYDKSVFHKFEFYPFGLSNKNYITDFYLPQNPQYVSGSEIENPVIDRNNVVKVQMHTFMHIMSFLKHDHVNLLKMDIEGSEFLAIPQLLEESNGSVEQICVEVHSRFYHDGEERLENLLNILYKNKYHLIDVSESKEELTFLKFN